MDSLSIYYQIGLDHILSMDALDHIAFLIALCAIYQVAQWKKILILVTAFTIGHSITLALVTFNILKISSSFVELLIPLTIIATGLINFFQKESIKSQQTNYVLALVFGAIHGMAFANTLGVALMPGESLWQSLLGFNIGVEVAQIVIVAIIMAISYVFLNLFQLAQKDWKNLVSGIAIGLAISMILG